MRRPGIGRGFTLFELALLAELTHLPPQFAWLPVDVLTAVGGPEEKLHALEIRVRLCGNGRKVSLPRSWKLS